MIFVTGDTHIPHDIRKLNTKNFPFQSRLSKRDFLIICGDFGGVWSRNSDEDKYWIDWLDKKNFTTLFVDGNHENFDLLEEYEVKEWNGGKVHFIRDSVIHLMRGQVFMIDGLKFFTMGGGTSVDKDTRTEGKSWWKQEIPSEEEFSEAFVNLEINDWEVDYVITHTTSGFIMEKMCYIKEESQLNRFFNLLYRKLKYKHWYFGHFHDDVEYSDEKHTLMYGKIIKI